MKVLTVSAGDAAARWAAAFRQRGWEPRSAGDVPTALMAARRERPDAVVTTAQLPGGGGELLVTRLRGLIDSALTPIVGVVADESERTGLLTAGASRCEWDSAGPQHLAEAVELAVAGERGPVGGIPEQLLADPDRLARIRDTGLEAGDADDALDELTRIVTDLLPAPTSLVSLVEASRQFFPGRTDVDGRQATGDRQTSLTHSFCQWAVTSERPLVVEDSRRHPVLRSNRAVEEDGVSAYIGVPLVVEGATAGTLCALDYQPRQWDEQDRELVEQLARLTALELRARTAAPRGGEEAPTPTAVAVAREGIDATVGLLRTTRPSPGRPAYDALLNVLERHASRLERAGQLLELPDLGATG